MTDIDQKTQHNLQLAIDAIEELKAENIQTLEVRELTTIADYMVICSGNTARHVKSIADNLVEKTKQAGLQPRLEGKNEASWILVDLNGVIIHIMQPDVRARYQIEKLWDIEFALPEGGTEQEETDND